MKTKKALLKSTKLFVFTLIAMFTGPIIIYQAFKNEEHPWYIPVLIIGLSISFGSIVLGFIALKTLLTSLFKD
ncbi:DUF6095 family protein [Leptobacterium sp. I13]|uniref:DUF6095 family protein n=1 Tax=Leptobacterium meishanense TaxID=3128904 RepID=UPI0030EEEE40